MRATCPNCQHAFSVPAEFAGKVVKCPQCKKLVNVPKNWSNSRFLLIVIISAALVGAIGFGLGILSSRHSRKETQANLTAMQAEVEQKTARLRDEIERLQTQIEQLKTEVGEAWVAKQNAEQELEEVKRLIRKNAMAVEAESGIAEKRNRKVDWEKLGFLNFYNIPDKGKVGLLRRLAAGNYGTVAPRFARILQILGPDEMLINYTLEAGLAWRPRGGTAIRVKGHSTRGLINDMSWPSLEAEGQPEFPEIAIIGTYTYQTTRGSTNTVLTAIPLDFVRRGLTVGEFEELLK